MLGCLTMFKQVFPVIKLYLAPVLFKQRQLLLVEAGKQIDVSQFLVLRFGRYLTKDLMI